MNQLNSSQLREVTGQPDSESHHAEAVENYPTDKAGDAGAFRSKPAHGFSGGKNVGDVERALSIGAGLGMTMAGLARGKLRGLALSALGAALVWRGYTGRCQCYAALGINTAKRNPATGVPAGQGYKLEKQIKINRSPEALFKFWRQLENLPQVMRHLKEVRQIDKQRSHWIAEGPIGKDVEWDAEIINERENEMIAWRSLPDGDIDTAGSVHFEPLEHGQGTEMSVALKYNPPAGKVGAQIASLLGAGLEKKLDEDLSRFKKRMEAGEEAAYSGRQW
jgi:uncharacterized membrane protein